MLGAWLVSFDNVWIRYSTFCSARQMTRDRSAILESTKVIIKAQQMLNKKRNFCTSACVRPYVLALSSTNSVDVVISSGRISRLYMQKCWLLMLSTVKPQLLLMHELHLENQLSSPNLSVLEVHSHATVNTNKQKTITILFPQHRTIQFLRNATVQFISWAGESQAVGGDQGEVWVPWLQWDRPLA